MWQPDTIRKHISRLATELINATNRHTFFYDKTDAWFYCKCCGGRRDEGQVVVYMYNRMRYSPNAWVAYEVVCEHCHDLVEANMFFRLNKKSVIERELEKQIKDYRQTLRKTKSKLIAAKRVGLPS